MAISKSISANAMKWGGAVTRTQSKNSGAYLAIATYSGTVDASGWNPQLDREHGSWGLGTGLIVDSTGSLIFNAEVQQGSLSEVILYNFGPNHCFIGINSETPSVATGIYLGTGMTYTCYSKIHDIWAIAISPTGTSAIRGGGPFMYSNDTI